MFCFHQVHEDIVDPRQVTFSLGLQPIENPRVDTYANRDLAPDVAQSNHAYQLLISQPRDIFEVDASIVSSRLTYSGATKSLPFLLIPLPVSDIFGRHLFQPRGLR